MLMVDLDVLLRRPVYVPSEAKITYTAGQVLAPHADSLLLAGGALNKLLQRRKGEDCVPEH